VADDTDSTMAAAVLSFSLSLFKHSKETKREENYNNVEETRFSSSKRLKETSAPHAHNHS